MAFSIISNTLQSTQACSEEKELGTHRNEQKKSPKNKHSSESWGRCGTNLSLLVRSATLATHNSAISRSISSAIVPLESHNFSLAFQAINRWNRTIYGRVARI